MEPPKPKPTELPEPNASEVGSELPTRPLVPNPLPIEPGVQQFTLPSAGVLRVATGEDAPPMTRRGHDLTPDPRAIAAAPVRHAMPQAQHAQPFRGGSPALVSLGGELLEVAPPRLVRARFPAHEGWFNTAGALSGGFVAAMFDVVLDVLLHANDPTRQHAVLESGVRFFRSIRGGWVIADATLVRTGRTIATIECYAWDTSNELCAKSSSTILFVG